MNINSHIDAERALLSGKKLRNIYYSDGEYLFFQNGQLTTEDGYTHGSFNDEFWTLQKRLPERWVII